jgi:hypothetical protein
MNFATMSFASAWVKQLLGGQLGRGPNPPQPPLGGPGMASAAETSAKGATMVENFIVVSKTNERL